MTEPLEDPPFIPSHDTVTSNPIYLEKLKTGVFLFFVGLFFEHSKTFLILLPHIQNKLIIIKINGIYEVQH